MTKSAASYEARDVLDRQAESSQDVKGQIKDYLAIFKMGIVNSNLITTFTGLWLALEFKGESFFGNLIAIIAVLVGTAFLIAGGCALNNYIDRDIDQLMDRTQERPSATGVLTEKQVLVAGLAMSVIGMLVLLIASSTAAAIGLVGLFFYVVVYTWWLKRTHSINTIVGGISGAVPPLIGWAAIDPTLASIIPWMLFLFMFLWQPPHFLALAIKRADEYKRAGIPMLPVVAGNEFTKRQMVTYVAVLVPVSLFLYQLGMIYIIAAAILGLAWLAISIAGFFIKDTIKWSRLMFVFSLNYMTILFVIMIISVI